MAERRSFFMPEERQERYGKGHPYNNLPKARMRSKAFHEAYTLWNSGVRTFPQEISTSWSYGFCVFVFFCDIQGLFQKRGRLPKREHLRKMLMNRQAILEEHGKRLQGKFEVFTLRVIPVLGYSQDAVLEV
jgi:hypothetical protein